MAPEFFKILFCILRIWVYTESLFKGGNRLIWLIVICICLTQHEQSYIIFRHCNRIFFQQGNRLGVIFVMPRDHSRCFIGPRTLSLDKFTRARS